jgi:hypothetical protein
VAQGVAQRLHVEVEMAVVAVRARLWADDEHHELTVELDAEAGGAVEEVLAAERVGAQQVLKQRALGDRASTATSTSRPV